MGGGGGTAPQDLEATLAELAARVEQSVKVTTEVASGFQQLGSAVRQLHDRVRNAESATADLTAGQRTISGKQDEQGAQLEYLKQRVNSLTEACASNGMPATKEEVIELSREVAEQNERARWLVLFNVSGDAEDEGMGILVARTNEYIEAVWQKHPASDFDPAPQAQAALRLGKAREDEGVRPVRIAFQSREIAQSVLKLSSTFKEQFDIGLVAYLTVPQQRIRSQLKPVKHALHTLGMNPHFVGELLFFYDGSTLRQWVKGRTTPAGRAEAQAAPRAPPRWVTAQPGFGQLQTFQHPSRQNPNPRPSPHPRRHSSIRPTPPPPQQVRHSGRQGGRGQGYRGQGGRKQRPPVAFSQPMETDPLPDMASPRQHTPHRAPPAAARSASGVSGTSGSSRPASSNDTTNPYDTLSRLPTEPLTHWSTETARMGVETRAAANAREEKEKQAAHASAATAAAAGRLPPPPPAVPQGQPAPIAANPEQAAVPSRDEPVSTVAADISMPQAAWAAEVRASRNPARYDSPPTTPRMAGTDQQYASTPDRPITGNRLPRTRSPLRPAVPTGGGMVGDLPHLTDRGEPTALPGQAAQPTAPAAAGPSTSAPDQHADRCPPNGAHCRPGGGLTSTTSQSDATDASPTSHHN
jgi:hypothetical protein